ncbi:unnamed protein product [Symbiodinium sp. CCMP2592]|nr:unnamed protein product [Symbiodinium sp. CCMP2592]
MSKLIQLLPVLRKEMRTGSTESFEKLYLKKVILLAKGILNNERPDVTLGFIRLVESCLALSKDTSGVLQLMQKLDSYCKSSASTLAAREVIIILKTFPPDRQGDLPSELQNTLQNLIDTTAQAKDFDIDKAALLLFDNAMFWSFRYIHSLIQAARISMPERLLENISKLLAILEKRVGSQELRRVWTEQFVQWMQESIELAGILAEYSKVLEEFESKGRDPQQREAADTDGKVLNQLLRTGNSAVAAVNKAAAFKQHVAAEEYGNNVSPLHIMYYDWSGAGRQQVENPVFLDTLLYRCSCYIRMLEQAQAKLNKATNGLHLVDGWKSGVDASSSYDECMKIAQPELTSTDGVAVESALNGLAEVIKAAKGFRNRIKDCDCKTHDLFVNQLPMSFKSLESGKAFKTEVLLVLAIQQVQLQDPSTQKWARDVIRAQLGDVAGNVVSEESILPQILEKARQIIG